VIATRNRKKLLYETILEIRLRQSLPAEIIVVDNGSDDGTGAGLESDFDNVVYKRLDSNHGIGAWNKGFEAARGGYIVILDDDSYPAFDLKEAVAKFDGDPTLGLIACNIIHNSSGNSEFSNEFTSRPERDTHYFIGCGAIARKDVLKAAGYYDERFFLYYNDNDLAARIIKNGFKVRFYREIKFIHKAALVHGRSGERFYFEFRNLLWYLIKNFPFRYLAGRIPKELRDNLKRAYKNRDLGFYLKAMGSTAVNLPYLIRRRRPFTRRELIFVLGKGGGGGDA
jgi:GT2 family glycosyltransferase